MATLTSGNCVECADVSRITSVLPTLLWDSINYPMTTSPLHLSTAIILTSSIGCWFLSVMMHNYSQVDRLWSILPVLYAFCYAAWESFQDTRLNVIFALLTLWGGRLSYNFYRKGGYNLHDEDYRWPELRKMMSPFLFQIFNITFIATYQNILLFLIVVPVHVCWLSRNSTPTLTTFDFVSISLFLAFWIGETVADQQQWNFQSKKYQLIREKKELKGDYAKGFLTGGLFRFSRHPNFFCEVSLWWAVYSFSVAATGVFFNWTIVGAILLTLLFQGSTNFTEKLTLRKYPQYAQYQKTTSRLIPFF